MIFILLLTSCAAYKVVPEGRLKTLQEGESFSIKKQNEWSQGAHCFEPLLYVISLGIIPTHCVDTYSISTESDKLGTVKVTSMQGWVTFFMFPFPAWQYGLGSKKDIENNVNNLIEVVE